LNIETAESTRLGDRKVNQDRACVVIGDSAVLLAVADGMGGHKGGELAAQAAIDSFVRSFKRERPLASNTREFLTSSIAEAHREVFTLGADVPYDHRPRTTIVLCIVADGVARWAHVGDSRAYLLRGGKVHARTRDHSAVESLYQQGQITEAVPLVVGDVLLLCSDGVWAPLDEPTVGRLCDEGADLGDTLDQVCDAATKTAAPHSDNTTAVAIRWFGDED
jgi:serine/threonine protein phosphatase PrpC